VLGAADFEPFALIESAGETGFAHRRLGVAVKQQEHLPTRASS
jgi:hypothetical protein